jgi:hypothetical protein
MGLPKAAATPAAAPQATNSRFQASWRKRCCQVQLAPRSFANRFAPGHVASALPTTYRTRSVAAVREVPRSTSLE